MRRSAALLRAAQSASRAAAAAPEASWARCLTFNAQVGFQRHAIAAAADAHAPERRARMRMQACNACLPNVGPLALTRGVVCRDSWQYPERRRRRRRHTLRRPGCGAVPLRLPPSLLRRRRAVSRRSRPATRWSLVGART